MTKDANTGTSPYKLLFNTGSAQSKHRDDSEDDEQGKANSREGENDEEEEEEEEEGEDEESASERGEQVHLEVVSESISQEARAPVWQIAKLPPESALSTPLQGQSSAGLHASEGSHAVEAPVERSGLKEADGLLVQQILLPPDTNFLSSFYEAADVSECKCTCTCTCK